MQSIRVGCALGARANAWHTEVFRALPAEIRPTILATSAGRYPVAEIELPVRLMPWANETGPWLARKLHNALYRLTHRPLGYEFPLRPPAGLLAAFDVLHTWELFTEWTRVVLDEKRRRGVPVVVTVWDNLPGHFADHRWRGPIRRRALAEADRFVVATERSRAALELDGVEPWRTVHVPPSVSAERFAPGDGGTVREQWGIAAAGCSIVAVARLEPAKGLCHLIDAVALAIRRAGSPLWLTIVGEGPQEAALRAQAAALGVGHRVRFEPQRGHRDMPPIYRAADIFVLPSVPTEHWQEQWGQSLLEAMASGCACIGSRSGAIDEVLGDAGLLVAPADAVELAAAIERLAADADVRREIGRRGRRRVEEMFAHRPAASALAALYQGLVAPGARVLEVTSHA